LLRQLALGRQAVAVAKLAGMDQAADLLGHVLIQPLRFNQLIGTGRPLLNVHAT
jgi:hypothetical protein